METPRNLLELHSLWAPAACPRRAPSGQASLCSGPGPRAVDGWAQLDATPDLAETFVEPRSRLLAGWPLDRPLAAGMGAGAMTSSPHV